MHATTAMALGIEYHRIDVQVPAVGGAFGGKTEQARFVVGATAVAAYSTKKPVRVAMPREEDTQMIGKRHAYYGQYQIAVDRGLANPNSLVNSSPGQTAGDLECARVAGLYWGIARKKR